MPYPHNWWTEDQQISHTKLIKMLEDAIEYIKTLGRSEYKKAYAEKKTNTDLSFKSISHSLDNAQGFDTWKNRLNAQVDLELHHKSITL